MKEIKGNLFDYPVICITTNNVVKKDNRLVMGKGIALEAKKLYPDIDLYFGTQLNFYGNKCFVYSIKNKRIINFPTKQHWKDDSTLDLIEFSCKDLVNITNIYKFDKVYLPKVGCGNGNLNWLEVKQVLEKYLDNRFTVVI